MKKLTLILSLLVATVATAQFSYDDCDNYKALGIGYIAPRSVVFDGLVVTGIGFNANIGAALSYPKTYKVVKAGAPALYDSIGNMLDAFATVGWRVIRRDFKYSLYLNVGGTMGDASKATPLVSARLVFPMNLKVLSIEPLYIFDRGYTIRATMHFKL